MKHFDDLTDREREFRELLQHPRAYSAWAAERRAEWEHANGVVWFHGYAGGRPIWKPWRPAPDPEQPMRFESRASIDDAPEPAHTPPRRGDDLRSRSAQSGRSVGPCDATTTPNLLASTSCARRT